MGKRIRFTDEELGILRMMTDYFLRVARDYDMGSPEEAEHLRKLRRIQAKLD